MSPAPGHGYPRTPRRSRSPLHVQVAGRPSPRSRPSQVTAHRRSYRAGALSPLTAERVALASLSEITLAERYTVMTEPLTPTARTILGFLASHPRSGYEIR